MPDIIEKHGALWPSGQGEEIVFEEHDVTSDLLHVIHRRNDGLFTATRYRKTIDPQWRLPWWSPASEAILASMAEAREYLSRPQEPWSHETFVAIYNHLADEQGGWHYDGDTPEEELERRYLSSPASWPDIRTFASGLFIWEQRLNL